MESLEVIVPGVPVSARTDNRQRLRDWKAVVREAGLQAVTAHGAWEVREMDWYVQLGRFGRPRTRHTPDGDNLAKPIFDALTGVVYPDDRFVIDWTVRDRDLEEEFRIVGASPTLVLAINRNEPFVHVLVKPLHSRSELPT